MTTTTTSIQCRRPKRNRPKYREPLHHPRRRTQKRRKPLLHAKSKQNPHRLSFQLRNPIVSPPYVRPKRPLLKTNCKCTKVQLQPLRQQMQVFHLARLFRLPLRIPRCFPPLHKHLPCLQHSRMVPKSNRPFYQAGTRMDYSLPLLRAHRAHRPTHLCGSNQCTILRIRMAYQLDLTITPAVYPWQHQEVLRFFPAVRRETGNATENGIGTGEEAMTIAIVIRGGMNTIEGTVEDTDQDHWMIGTEGGLVRDGGRHTTRQLFPVVIIPSKLDVPKFDYSSTIAFCYVNRSCF